MADKLTEEGINPTAKPKSDDKPVKESQSKEEQRMDRIAQLSATDPNKLSDQEIQEFSSWKMRKTKEMLDSEPKVPIYIPYGFGEKKNNPATMYQFFQINGYPIRVRKGVDAMVPLSIKKLYQESVDADNETANSPDLIDNIGMKIDPVTNAPKSSAHL